jgi:hypothetical protein
VSISLDTCVPPVFEVSSERVPYQPQPTLKGGLRLATTPPPAVVAEGAAGESAPVGEIRSVGAGDGRGGPSRRGRSPQEAASGPICQADGPRAGRWQDRPFRFRFEAP